MIEAFFRLWMIAAFFRLVMLMKPYPGYAYYKMWAMEPSSGYGAFFRLWGAFFRLFIYLPSAGNGALVDYFLTLSKCTMFRATR